jgi:hypothetical protein
MRASSSPTLSPSMSRWARTKSGVNTPVKAPEPIITGVKREPSSLVQNATSSGARVRMPGR